VNRRDLLRTAVAGTSVAAAGCLGNGAEQPECANDRAVLNFPYRGFAVSGLWDAIEAAREAVSLAQERGYTAEVGRQYDPSKYDTGPERYRATVRGDVSREEVLDIWETAGVPYESIEEIPSPRGPFAFGPTVLERRTPTLASLAGRAGVQLPALSASGNYVTVEGAPDAETVDTVLGSLEAAGEFRIECGDRYSSRITPASVSFERDGEALNVVLELEDEAIEEFAYVVLNDDKGGDAIRFFLDSERIAVRPLTQHERQKRERARSTSEPVDVTRVPVPDLPPAVALGLATSLEHPSDRRWPGSAVC